MFKHMSVRKSLLFPILILLFIYIVSIYFTSNICRQLTSSVINNYEKLAYNVSTTFSRYIETIWATEEMVGRYINNSLPKSENSELSEYLKLLISRVNGIQKAAYLNANGQLLFYTDNYNDDELLTLSQINEIKNGNTKLITCFTTNSYDGSVMNNVNVARGIVQDGQLKGIVTALLDFNKINEHLANMIPEKDVFFSITDNNGAVIFHNKDFSFLSRNTDGSEAVTVFLDESVAPDKFAVIEKDSLVGMNYPISSIGWACRVSFKYNSVMSSLYDNIAFNLITLFVLILVFVYVLAYLNRRIIRPVNSLKNAIDKFINKDYSARTNIKGFDEILLTCRAFDQMAECIEHLYLCKSQFNANLTHEIKTPLNVIFASVQLIENYKSITNPEVYKAKISNQMKIIRQNCYRLIRLTSNILDITKHDNGFLKIKLNNYDIVKLVRNITESIKKYTEAKGIDLVFSSEPESSIIACDPDMIERIILNLISNAIKFTDENGEITVRISEKEESILLSVKDTGIGIPQSKLNCIFERFKQADETLNRNPDGTGIGLSLVKAFVEAHNGNISVKSEVMKGTEFIIELPKKTVDNKTNDIENQRPALSPNDISRINIEFSDIYPELE
ncbi:MAG: HAMP domain-containing histidine kinase [Clostridiaceae bacterium]|nr:HAMP domain-containing histidine kinase [Clostridiaceae bacterium]